MKLVEFNLVEEECLSGKFPNSGAGPAYLGNLSASGVECIPGNGVKLNASAVGVGSIKSSRDVTDLKGAIEQGGGSFTIETWVDSKGTGGALENQYLYSVCKESNGKCNLALRENDDSDRPNYLESRFGAWTDGSSDEKGYVFNASSLRTSGSRVHVSISVSTTKIDLYVQGQLVYNNSESETAQDSSKWFDEGVISLLGSTKAVTDYSGTHIGMYYWSMWSPALSATETLSRFSAGSPNSRPIAYDIVTSVQQNGEVGDHSNDPAFYSTEIVSAELATITLLPYDYDNVQAVSEEGMVRAEITSLPSNGGTLYHANGTQISVVPTEVFRNSSTGNITVRFRPKLNVHSASDTDYVSNFTYCAREGPGGEGLVSLTDGLVLIAVSHVNQPPVPASNSNATVFAAALTTLPALTGTDVDGAIVNAAITTLPERGQLYDVYPNGSISTTELVVNSQLSTFSVAYIYTGPQSTAVNNDSFAFTLTDDDGFTSVPASFALSAKVAVVALPAPVRDREDEAIIVEGGSGIISLGGIDHSDARRSLCVRVSSVPLHGSLFDPADPLRTPLAAGDTLSSCFKNYSARVDIGYNASSHFFTWPSSDWHGISLAAPFGACDTFKWGLYAEEDGSLSEVISQNVSVLNRNSATTVQYNDDGGGITVRPIAYWGDNSASLTGFLLQDPDFDADLVRVKLESQAGARLTLHRDYIDQVDFNSATYCYSNLRWQCKGSGYTEDEMSFVGTPSKVALALSSVTYESSKADTKDTVTLTIYDGEGGECLDLEKLSASRFEGCHQRSTSVSVTVLGYEEDTDDDTIFQGDPRSFFLSNAILFGMLAVCICICCACGRMFFRCWKRKCSKKDKQLLEHEEGDIEASHKGGQSSRSPTSTASSATLHLDNIYPTAESAFSGVFPSERSDAPSMGEKGSDYEYPWPSWPEKPQHLSVLATSPLSPLSPQRDHPPDWFSVNNDA